MGGSRPALAALLVVLLSAPVALSTHTDETLPPVVASGSLDGPGWFLWTIRAEGWTEVAIRHSASIDGVFGGVATEVFDLGGDPGMASLTYLYGRGPHALLGVQDTWFVPFDEHNHGGAGGGLYGECREDCSGTYLVASYAAGPVTRFEASFHMDNATLLDAKFQEGGTFAWTTRRAGEPAPTGLFGPMPQDRSRPLQGGVDLPVEGRLLGTFFGPRDGSVGLTVTTPAGARACDQCLLREFRDGPGDYSFRYDAASDRGDVFLVAADVPLPR